MGGAELVARGLTYRIQDDNAVQGWATGRDVSGAGEAQSRGVQQRFDLLFTTEMSLLEIEKQIKI